MPLSYSGTGHLLLREFELLVAEEELDSTRRQVEDKVKEARELRAVLEGLRGKVLEKGALFSQLRTELLEAKAKASSRDTLMRQNQILSQRIEALSKENLSLVKHKNCRVHFLEVDLEETKTVIEALKLEAEADKTLKPFDSPVSTGLGDLPVGSTPSTVTGRTPSYCKRGAPTNRSSRGRSEQASAAAFATFDFKKVCYSLIWLDNHITSIIPSPEAFCCKGREGDEKRKLQRVSLYFSLRQLVKTAKPQT
ncbi:hypothetical protein Esti_002374 [Eimeria stiedai]